MMFVIHCIIVCRLEILSVFVVLIAVLVVGASVVVWGEERSSAYWQT